MSDINLTVLEIFNHVLRKHPEYVPSFERMLREVQAAGAASVRGALDPTNISEEEAKEFFARLTQSNTSMVRAAETEIRRAKVIFDVGANSGFFAKELIEAGFGGRIVLFEPIPNLMSIAVKTLAKFNLEKVFVNSALGESSGEIDLYLPDDSNIGWITAVGAKATSRRTIKVRIANAGDFIALFKPEFVKMDVEGFELFVLRPFLPFIGDSYKPSFLVELGWGVSNPNWSEFMLVARRLAELGYRFIRVDVDKVELTLDDLATLGETIDVLITAFA